MASAAAVATNVSKSPLPDNERDEGLGIVGTITRADSLPGEDEDDDDDDDVVPRGRRRKAESPAFPDLDDEDREVINGGAEEEDGLFGSEDEEQPAKTRQLDDDELDSGDDEDRYDRLPEDDYMQDGEPPQEEELAFMDVDIGRHPIPEPSDGELYLLKIPSFLSIDPHAFQHQTFQPPITDHHSKTAPSNTFSAYNTAVSTIRWRRSPNDPSQLQSNCRVVRWSDGSLTLQFATNPGTHYPITANTLAPPQHNPSKPTPTSVKDKQKGREAKYSSEQDSFTYLAAPQERAQVLRITNKVTAGLKIQSATDASAEALERLQHSLATAANAMGDAEGSGIGMIRITEDPELAKKKAELAEKEKMKAQRRREAQEARDRERHGRVLGRKGMGGLTVGGLEDDDELGKGSARLPGVGRRAKQSRRQRKGEIYSEDEEEYGHRGRTREDEYDEEDDFVARSDEEEEVPDDDEDEDDGIEEPPRPTSRRQELVAERPRTPKRELDAEGDLEDETGPAALPAGSPSGRSKRRRVIEEDEDEE